MSIPAPDFWWKFDDTVADPVVPELGGIELTYTPGATFVGTGYPDYPGQFGRSIFFTGNDPLPNAGDPNGGVIEKAAASPLLDFSGDFTIAIWVNAKDWTLVGGIDSFWMIVAKRLGTGLWPYNYAMYLSPGATAPYIGCQVRDALNNVVVVSHPIDFAAEMFGQWHLCAMTYVQSTGTLELRVDGALVGTDTFGAPTTPAQATGSKLQIGATRGGTNCSMYGFLDNLMMWDGTALDEDQNRELFYGADVNTMTLTATSPTSGQSDVTLNTSVQGSIADSANTVDYTKTKIWIGAAKEARYLAYDGNGAATPADGIQSGWAGTFVSDGSGGYNFNLAPTGGQLFETYAYNVFAEAENDAGGTLDDAYPFETLTVEIIKNSGFEARRDPHVIGQARNWQYSGYDPNAQLGVKRGSQVPSPGVWPPPEGEHVATLGSIDLSEPLAAEESRIHTIGVGTSGIADSFGPVALPITEGHYVKGGSVSVRRDTTEVATDDGDGGIAGTGVKGWLDYWTPRVAVREDSAGVWGVGEDVNIYYDTRPLFMRQTCIPVDDSGAPYLSAVDLTAYNFFKFSYKWVTPSFFAAGETWRLRCLLDGHLEVFSKDVTVGDESDSDSASVVYNTTAIVGTGHFLQFVLEMDLGDPALIEDFENAPSNREADFVESLAVSAEFNDGADEYEGFETAPSNREIDYNQGSAISADFNDGADDVEEFENWD